MKTYILNTLPFVFAFFVVTGAIIYLNGQYNNIFQFDFTPRYQTTAALKDSLDTNLKNKAENKSDSLIANTESLQDNLVKNDTVNTALESVTEKIIAPEVKSEIKEISKRELTAQLEKKPEPEVNRIEPKFASNDLNQNQEEKQQNKDSDYQDWLKKVSKLLEQMEPAKAAKIIQNYSDNVARDIIYSMNKKVAAKIVSELSPEVAQRIIRYD
ncbi:hypothetical protein [Ignavibacterium sp.]|uniref:magnesium transporter MgtE N-terminal domain-containing protein n=1 Tax=Ignavibacterium sp. TaxID=2651167 RepID=UPI00307F718C